MKKTTMTKGRKVAQNVKAFLLTMVTLAIIAGFGGLLFVTELRETFRAEVLKEETFTIVDDFGIATTANFNQSTDVVRKQYRRNGNIVVYETHNGDIRCWLEFYSGVRIEVTHFGWAL